MAASQPPGSNFMKNASEMDQQPMDHAKFMPGPLMRPFNSSGGSFGPPGPGGTPVVRQGMYPPGGGPPNMPPQVRMGGPPGGRMPAPMGFPGMMGGPGGPRPGMPGPGMGPMHPGHMGGAGGGPPGPPHHDPKQHGGGSSKRPHPSNMHGPSSSAAAQAAANRNKKKRRIGDKILPQKVRDLVPGSQAYMDLLAFERTLDDNMMRKRLEYQEALKRPMKHKKKLRIFISNTCIPAKLEEDGSETAPAAWELKVEGRLIEEVKMVEIGKPKKKFSTYFKSLVIELDKELYGPDNHLVEWQRSVKTQETDGFQVTRPGDQNVKCTILLMLDNKSPKHKLDSRLARLLGIHSESRPAIITALWQYIKSQRLQDPTEREFIKCDRYLAQIFGAPRLKFADIPHRLGSLLMPPDPIVINHTIVAEGPDAGKKTAAYDIEVEVDSELKGQMESFLMSSQSQQELVSLDTKIYEGLEVIGQLKQRRDFFMTFCRNPQEFISNWLVSQTKDLKTMTEVVGNPEEERKSEFFSQSWVDEAVSRYVFSKVQQKRMELERAFALQSA